MQKIRATQTSRHSYLGILSTDIWSGCGAYHSSMTGT